MQKELKTLGKCIKLERKKQSIKSLDFAKIINRSKWFLSQIENGSLAPSAITVYAIANALKMEQKTIDNWLALIKFVPTDVQEIIFEHPAETCTKIRSFKSAQSGNS